MDTNAVDQTARQWLSRSPTGDDTDAEIARLRERLAFFQSFEGLIQDNIARSGELLRQAMEMRESANVEIAAAQAEAARQRADDRSRYRIHFSAMLDELTALQGQAERLAHRLTLALDEIESDLPPAATAPSLAEIDLGDEDVLKQALALDAGALAFFNTPTTMPEEEEPLSFAESPAEPSVEGMAAIEEDEIAAEPARDPGPPAEVESTPDVAAAATLDDAAPADVVSDDAPDDIPIDVQPFALEDMASPRHFAADDDLALQPTFEPSDVSSGAAQALSVTATNATIVLVHGVPRATTALSLKRYLEGLSHVGTVEPREFAEGILRLEVSSNRPLAFDDLRSWSEGRSLEPVHLRDDLVEVRLSH